MQRKPNSLASLMQAPVLFLKLLATPQPGGVNYILWGERQHETFAFTHPKDHKRKDSKVLKAKNYTYRDLKGSEKKMGVSHGIDDADAADDSNDEPHNYSPMDRFNNEQIRNHHVTHIVRKKQGQYKEIEVRSPNPILTDDNTPIPEGYLQTTYWENSIKTYYFPNFIDYDQLVTKA